MSYMKILYVLRSMAMLAGTERVISAKINWLACHGYDVTLVTYEQGKHSLPFPLDSRVNVIDLDTRFFLIRNYSIFRRFICYLHLKALLKNRLGTVVNKFHPDVIITTAYSLKIADVLLEFRNEARLVMESHETCYSVLKAYDYRHSFLMKYIAAFFDNRSMKLVNEYDCLVTLTEGDAKEWREKGVKNVEVIPNPLSVYPKDVSNDTDRPFGRIISVGRLEKVKGFDFLISAFALISDKCPNWRIDIYGAGSCEEELLDMIASKGMDGRISICTPTEGIYDEYLRSDFCVLSSRHEGFGMVLLEAMSCGIPCVAFDCKYGPGEIIKSGYSGLLVKDGDIHELSLGILWLIEHQEERLKMGQRSREDSYYYQNDLVMKHWTNLFDKLCQ